MTRSISHRILFDASPLIGNKTGIGQFTERLLLSLADDGVLIDAYYFDFLGRKSPRLIEHPNIHYRHVRFFPKKILSLLNRHGIEIPIEVFTGWCSYKCILYTNYASMPSLLTKKSIVCIYDMGYADHPDYLDDKNLSFMRKAIPTAVRRCEAIITISDFTKSRVLEHFPNIDSDNIVVVPIPYEQSADPKSVDDEQILGIKELMSKPYLLYVGTLEPRKNLEKLVDGYMQSSIKGTHNLILMGGKGWKCEGLMEKISSPNVRQHVFHTGYVPDGVRDMVYKHADLICFLSHYEGFGMPILEAAHYKKQMLLSDIPVFHEVAGNSAFYCDKDSAASISQGIVTALSEPKKDVSRIGSTYSWRSNSKVIRGLIEHTLQPVDGTEDIQRK